MFDISSGASRMHSSMFEAIEAFLRKGSSTSGAAASMFLGKNV